MVRNAVNGGWPMFKQRGPTPLRCWAWSPSIFCKTVVSQTFCNRVQGSADGHDLPVCPRLWMSLEKWVYQVGKISYHRKVQEMWEWIICGKVWLKIWLTAENHSNQSPAYWMNTLLKWSMATFWGHFQKFQFSRFSKMFLYQASGLRKWMICLLKNGDSGCFVGRFLIR